MRKTIYLCFFIILVLGGCNNDTRTILREHESSISPKGGSINIEGNYNFYLNEIIEIVESKEIIHEIPAGKELNYLGEWYSISIDKEKRLLSITIKGNESQSERKLLISVHIIGNLFDNYSVYQKNL
mgnify:CR=1 FL=1